MTQERWQQIEEILQAALDLQPDKRAAFLDEACAGDDELRREVESYLAREDSSEHFIETAAMKVVARGLAEADLSGQKISHYQILKPIGEGGMGKVYLATDSKLNRKVAIKFLPETFIADPERVRRFQREAHAAAALNHPNIMTVYEVGDDADLPYFTCEHIAGVTLRERMQSGALPWQEIVKIATQVASAIQTAHKSGIVHRDIKPENVMLRADGLVKVLDFGIAKHLDLVTFDSANEAQPTNGNATINVYQTNFTRTQGLLGTPNYMSPEQLRGEELTPQTDVFSFGLMLYEMLAEHPYAALSPAEKLSALQSPDELPPLGKLRPDIPTALAELVTQATRKKIAVRTITAEQMHSTLEELHSSLEMRAAGHSQQLAQERANKLLNQVAALYASDAGTRLSLTEWWTIQRRSNALRGKLEQKLLRKSLLSILAKASAVAGLAVIMVFMFAAWISVTQRWYEQVLRDGHSNLIRQFAISPNGKKLVSVGNDHKIIVWDYASRARLATLTHDNQHNVSAVAFAPDGRLFATSCTDGTVNVWDAENYSKRAVVGGYKLDVDVRRIAFSPDGRWLLTATGGSQSTLWETENWQKVRDFAAHGFGAEAVPSFSPDSRYLLGHTMQILEVATGVVRTPGELPQRASAFWNVLSPDARQYVIAEYSGEVSFLDFSEFWTHGRGRIIKQELAHRERVRAAAYSSDGRYVATGAETTILWDAKTRTKLARFSYMERPTYLAFTPDAKELVASYGDAQMLVWDVEEREQKFSFVGHSHPVRAVAYAPDGKTIASAGDDQSIILWDVASGRKLTVLTGHRTRISALEFSADGKDLLSTDIHKNTNNWELDTKRVRRRFTMPDTPKDKFGYGVALSPNQQWIATSFGVHARDDGRVVADFHNKDVYLASEYYAVKFSPDGHWLIGVTPANQVNLWDTRTWALCQTALPKPGGTDRFISLAISPDSRWFVTGQDQGQVRLWSVEPLREIAVIGEHKSYVRSVAFSHDGRFVASASDDKTLKLWDVARRKLVEEIGIHTSPVLAVAFSPDDKHLVTGEYDNSVRIYTRQRSLWGWKLD